MHSSDRGRGSSRSNVHSVTNSSSWTWSSGNLSQQCYSQAVYASAMWQWSMTQLSQSTRINTALQRTHNKPYWHICLKSKHVSTHCQTGTPDVSEKLVSLADRKFSYWPASTTLIQTIAVSIGCGLAFLHRRQDNSRRYRSCKIRQVPSEETQEAFPEVQ